MDSHLDDNILRGLCVIDLFFHQFILILGAVAGVATMLDTILGKRCDSHRTRFCEKQSYAV